MPFQKCQLKVEIKTINLPPTIPTHFLTDNKTDNGKN